MLFKARYSCTDVSVNRLFEHLQGFHTAIYFALVDPVCYIGTKQATVADVLSFSYNFKPVIPNLFQVKTPYHCLFDFMKPVPFFLPKRNKSFMTYLFF